MSKMGHRVQHPKGTKGGIGRNTPERKDSNNLFRNFNKEMPRAEQCRRESLSK